MGWNGMGQHRMGSDRIGSDRIGLAAHTPARSGIIDNIVDMSHTLLDRAMPCCTVPCLPFLHT
jgi:hypothetical protein